jgi:hypothetical protein|tara:strand:+ start:430 stop:603 length:174 start_codon:yes stop_codon:yes gene_type:complete
LTSKKLLLDPEHRSWYYDGFGVKRDKETDEVIDEIKNRNSKATKESNQATERKQSKD